MDFDFNKIAKSVLDSTDIDEKLKEKTGIDLGKIDLPDIDPKVISEVTKLIGDNLKNVDIASIAKKVGVDASVVSTILSKIKK